MTTSSLWRVVPSVKPETKMVSKPASATADKSHVYRELKQIHNQIQSLLRDASRLRKQLGTDETNSQGSEAGSTTTTGSESSHTTSSSSSSSLASFPLSPRSEGVRLPPICSPAEEPPLPIVTVITTPPSTAMQSFVNPGNSIACPTSSYYHTQDWINWLHSICSRLTTLSPKTLPLPILVPSIQLDPHLKCSTSMLTSSQIHLLGTCPAVKPSWTAQPLSCHEVLRWMVFFVQTEFFWWLLPRPTFIGLMCLERLLRRGTLCLSCGGRAMSLPGKETLSCQACGMTLSKCPSHIVECLPWSQRVSLFNSNCTFRKTWTMRKEPISPLEWEELMDMLNDPPRLRMIIEWLFYARPQSEGWMRPSQAAPCEVCGVGTLIRSKDKQSRREMYCTVCGCCEMDVMNICLD
eukprot:Protomagalhaensia_sp_Gyna_25__5975@NODE_927_length_2409_cov_46_459494_g733_i0_p1_GENE_NODE_927_length_2409_cov_46_459494_g733_i0NODE_927_length_2409_cov_46_459494_g733_i0_p1_ORF_typecomplete_len407_score22_72HeLo/PF14479_6/0_0083zfC4H2/PF10146_9/0_024DUF1635/PF07795_11/0_047HOOK/PF05622_12/0_19Dynamin_M/PF01031_20/0_26OrfB_Zn_ribbon/PF07282_11/6_5OrfB_Zn_ribbon/PF07282_11/65_NODE_927_length_2409_cov_46_459494_g733_i03241544